MDNNFIPSDPDLDFETPLNRNDIPWIILSIIGIGGLFLGFLYTEYLSQIT